jgi:hypothetical protein
MSQSVHMHCLQLPCCSHRRLSNSLLQDVADRTDIPLHLGRLPSRLTTDAYTAVLASQPPAAHKVRDEWIPACPLLPPACPA